MNDLRKQTLQQYLGAVSKDAKTWKQTWDDIHSSISEQNPELNVYLTNLTQQSSFDQKSSLKGAPLAVKDNFAIRDSRTTAASSVLGTFKPPYDSTVISKLRIAGATFLGKTNLDAWAHGSSTETSQYGATKNPRNTDHLPGGSSGGSAAAVAADLCVAAIGTETAGSIRQPAAWCGIVGLKPSYGRVSRFGIAAMASSTDSPGPMTKTVADAALLLNHMAGHDTQDGTTSPQKPPDFTSAIGKKIKGMKVGLLYNDLDGLEIARPHISTAADVLTNLGADVQPVSSLDPRLAISVYTIIQRGEVSSNLARYDGIRYGKDRSHFGPEAQRRIMLGTHILSAGYTDKYYLTAQKVRTAFAQNFTELFTKFDVLISATSPSFAKKSGASEDSAMFGELEDMLLEPSSITGLPGISVPCYRDPETNLYLGLNVMAPMWQEERVIQVAAAYEAATKWNSWNNNHE